MPLVRALAKVDAQGKIQLPSNVRRMTGLAPGDRVEIRLQGRQQRSGIVLHRRTHSGTKLRTALPAIPCPR